MDDNFGDGMMNKFMKQDTKSDKEFGDFMKKVDEIQALVTGMSSKDDKISKESVEKADKYLEKTDISKKTNKSSDTDSDNETGNGDNIQNTKNKKKTFNRTVINHEAFKEEEPKTINQEGLMKAMEEDAERRTEERKKRKLQAGEWKEKGEKLFAEGNIQEALKAFNKALSIFKDWPALWTGRAQVHLRLNNLKQALDDCDWAFRSDEKSLNAHVTMSRIRRHEKKYVQATEVLEKALLLHPNKNKIIKKHLDEIRFEELEMKDTETTTPDIL